MTTKYAEGTTVPIDRSRAEIESLLDKYGASSFAYMRDDRASVIVFRLHDRTIKLRLEAPSMDDESLRYRKLRGYRQRLTDMQTEIAVAKEHRRRWRALALILKAKLEAVHSGVLSMEEEFLPYMVLADGRTVAEWGVQELRPALDGGTMPRALLGSGQ